MEIRLHLITIEINNPILKTRELSIPFASEREAEIAFDVLRVDKEPPRSQVSKSLTQNNNNLNVSFSAPSAQQLRVGVNGFLEHVTLVAETLESFGPAKSTKYSYK